MGSRTRSPGSVVMSIHRSMTFGCLDNIEFGQSCIHSTPYVSIPNVRKAECWKIVEKPHDTGYCLSSASVCCRSVAASQARSVFHAHRSGRNVLPSISTETGYAGFRWHVIGRQPEATAPPSANHAFRLSSGGASDKYSRSAARFVSCKPHRHLRSLPKYTCRYFIYSRSFAYQRK